jgi:iron complex transport system substrate-binding protein
MLMILTLFWVPMPSHSGERTLTDAVRREVKLPDRIERVICSGAGCLRLLTYLQAQNLIVAVDDIEKRCQSPV